MANSYVFVGKFVSTPTLGNLDIHVGYIWVKNGVIIKTGSTDEFERLRMPGNFIDSVIVYLEDNEFMMPGFVDCHTHAPQFPNLGVGLDLPLLEWLDKYTFPLEKKYSNVSFAEEVYSQVVKRLIKNGTTTACYFGSLHLDSTIALARVASECKQRALVGKVSMNIVNDADYYNTTEEELEESKTFVESVQALGNDLVEPVITPRFALSCDETLMTGLAAIAKEYNCRIQSHISENHKEIEAVLALNPDSKSYSEVYDKSNILNNQCIMAHGVHLDTEEMQLLASKGVSIAHCPSSNTRLRSGLCPVRKLLDHNITVGLGTDVSGGESASVLQAARRCMDVSAHLQLLRAAPAGRALGWREALYLATMGGARALNLDDKIGDFQVKKQFDALRINVFDVDSQIDRYNYSIDTSDEEEMLSLIQRFLYLGDDRNITEVYVKGERIK